MVVRLVFASAGQRPELHNKWVIRKDLGAAGDPWGVYRWSTAAKRFNEFGRWRTHDAALSVVIGLQLNTRV